MRSTATMLVYELISIRGINVSCTVPLYKYECYVPFLSEKVNKIDDRLFMQVETFFFVVAVLITHFSFHL